MFTQISFRNFRAIQEASIALGPFNLIIGANESGKSTVVQAILALHNRIRDSQGAVSLGRDPDARHILEDALLGQAWIAGAIGAMPLRA